MKSTKAGRLKMVFAGLICIFLCWSAYSMLGSEGQGNNTSSSESKLTSTADRVSGSTIAKSSVPISPEPKKDPSGGDSAGQQNQHLGKIADRELNLDEVVIPSLEDGKPGKMVREIRALHERQLAEMRANQNLDEFVIPPSEDGDPGTTLREILALHEEQLAELTADQSLNEIVALPSENGEPGMTLGETLALHEEQEAEIFAETVGGVGVLPSEDGEIGLTVWDLKALHEQQLAEMAIDRKLDEFLPPSEDGEIELESTRGDIQALQERQQSVRQ